MFVHACHLLLAGFLCVAAESTRPKALSFAQLQKLAASIVGSKDPGPLPTYEIKSGTLVYSLPPSPMSGLKDGPDLEPTVLGCLMQTRGFLRSHPKGMPKAALKAAVEGLEGKVKKAFDRARREGLKGKKLAALLEGVDKDVREGIQDAIVKEAKRAGLRPVTLTTTLVVKVSTDPVGGKVHCITLHQKMLFEARGLKPEVEVMKYVLSDTMSIEGKVYYVVTWAGGKKSGPSILEIVGKAVVFK